ncbi:MAG: hypothetical protein ABI726_06910 [bacterium]
MTLTILLVVRAAPITPTSSPNSAPARRWYLSKANPSVADVLTKLGRAINASQYRPRYAGNSLRTDRQA